MLFDNNGLSLALFDFLCTKAVATSSLLDKFSAFFTAASLFLRSMSNANPSTPDLVGASLMVARFVVLLLFCPMPDADSFLLRKIVASLMAAFLFGSNLCSKLNANSSPHGSIGASFLTACWLLRSVPPTDTSSIAIVCCTSSDRA